MSKHEKKKPFAFRQDFTLSALSIDQASESIFQLMLDGGMDRKNALRVRLSVEEIMLNWQQQLGEDALCRIIAGKRMGRATLNLQVRGAQFNPLQSETSDGDSYQKSILSGLGMAPVYRYGNGINQVLLRIPRKGLSTPAGILIAIVLALIAGLALGRLPADTIAFLDTGILQPLMNAFMRALSTVAGPLIFLSVLTGISSIGNRENLGRMGGRLVKNSLLFTLLLCLVPMITMTPSITGAAGGSGSTNMISSLLDMVLDTIPSTVVEPFSSGNTLQIIIIAVFFGLAILALGAHGSMLKDFCEEMNQVVLFVMGLISKLLPAFIFVSVLQMMLSGMFATVLDAYMLLVQLVLCSLLVMAAYVGMICVKFRIAPGKLIKKQLPTFIIAITTASSAAAFATNSEACEKQLGISRKLTSFGLPLGQVLYKPGGVLMYMLVALFTAEKYQLAITPGWILIAMLLCTALTVATPPVAGGALTSYTIIFTQLILPMEYLPVILSLNMVMDFIVTSTNLFCLQNQLILIADKSGELKQEILKA